MAYDGGENARHLMRLGEVFGWMASAAPIQLTPLTPDEKRALGAVLEKQLRPVLCSKCNSPTSEIGLEVMPSEHPGVNSPTSEIGDPAGAGARQKPAGGATPVEEWQDYIERLGYDPAVKCKLCDMPLKQYEWQVADWFRRGAEIERLQRIIQRLGKKNRRQHEALHRAEEMLAGLTSPPMVMPPEHPGLAGRLEQYAANLSVSHRHLAPPVLWDAVAALREHEAFGQP